jgi:hypothetical protein
MAEASADIPFFCGVAGVSTIHVNNPLSTSIYTWRTFNGNIVGDTVGPSITVNMPGSYIVSQELLDSCGTTYARDTVTVTLDPFCTVLKAQVLNLSGALKGNNAFLQWQLNNNESARWLELERSTGNNSYELIKRIENNGNNGSTNYIYTDVGAPFSDNSTVFYRVKLVDHNGNSSYSNTIGISSEEIAQPSVLLMGNPVKNQPLLIIKTLQSGETRIVVTDHSGKIVYRENKILQKGINVVTLSGEGYNKAGMYILIVETGNARFTQKMAKLP